MWKTLIVAAIAGNVLVGAAKYLMEPAPEPLLDSRALLIASINNDREHTRLVLLQSIETCLDVGKLKGGAANVASEIVVRAIAATDGNTPEQAQDKLYSKGEMRALFANANGEDLDFFEKHMPKLRDSGVRRCVLDGAAERLRT
jgi:hypothetical protein